MFSWTLSLEQCGRRERSQLRSTSNLTVCIISENLSAKHRAPSLSSAGFERLSRFLIQEGLQSQPLHHRLNDAVLRGGEAPKKGSETFAGNIVL